MPFSNPIVGGAGGTLIRDSIQSGNYTVGPDGTVTGWQIARDGSAVFTDVAVGNTSWGIDPSGTATVSTLNVSDSDITIGGDSLAATLAQIPRGIVAWETFAQQHGPYAAESGYGELSMTLDPDRLYRYSYRVNAENDTTGKCLVLNTAFTMSADAGTTPAAPLVGGTLLLRSQIAANDVGGRDLTMCDFAIFTTGAAVPVQVRLLLCLAPITTGSVYMRSYGDGTGDMSSGSPTQGATMCVEDIGPARGQSGVYNLGGGGVNPAPQTYTKTWTCTWSGSYYGDGSRRNTSGSIYQGYYSGYPSNGNQKSMIGFDYASIQSALSGATVTKVEVYLYFDHWYYDAGGTAVLGTHNSSAGSAPSSWSGTASRTTSSSWPKPGGRWVSVGTTIGNELKAGTSKGIVIGPGDSTAATYYGYADGYGDPHPPQLRITYTK